MNPILESVAEFLRSKQLRFSVGEGGTPLVFFLAGNRLAWSCEVTANQDGTMVTFLARIPVRVPEARRAACAEQVTRLNFGRRQGAFHLDARDGELLFCISNLLPAPEVPDPVVEALLGLTYAAMEQEAFRLLRLAWGSPPPPATPEGPRPPAQGNRLELN